jgi:MoxR-like ATPase
MAELADMVHADRAIIRYVRELAEASREVPDVRIGLSTRGALAWIRAAKTWALTEGRGHVVPEDVATLARPVLGHRLLMSSGAAFGGVTPDEVVGTLLTQVPAPRDRA